MYGKRLFGNCDIRLCLGASDTLTAQYFCDLLGVATAETQSIRKEVGIEGDLEYGQKNISTLQRNLLNADEILRIPQKQLLANIRGNKPLLLDKMIYTEHPLASKLRDMPISEYNPNWNKDNNATPGFKITNSCEKSIRDSKTNFKEDISFDIF